MSRKLLVTLLVGLGLLLPAALVAAPAPPLHDYLVVPGDSCWSIAEKLFGDGQKYTLIHKYNDLGPLPHVLKPGQLIKVPAATRGPEAKLDWLQKDVKAKPPWDLGWRQAARDMPLWRLFRLSTGGGSAASILFADKSQLRMREKALLVIYGPATNRPVAATRQVGHEVQLEQGTLRGGLARLDQEANLQVKTPAGQVDLKSQDSLIQVDALKSTLVSVFDGLAKVMAQGAQVEVPANHGTVVKAGKKPTPPKPLLPPVEWSEGTVAAVIPAFQDAGCLPFQVDWQPLAGAQRYHVELARAPDFKQVLVDAETGAGIHSFQVRSLEAGSYYARIAGIDGEGLEGRASEPLELKVVPLELGRRLVPGADGIPESVGLLRVAFPAAEAAQVEVSVADEPFRSFAEPVRLATPGVYPLRFRPRGSVSLAELQVRLLGVTGRIEAPARHTGSQGAALPVAITIQDERGRPAHVPELQMFVGLAPTLPPVAAAPGGASPASPPTTSLFLPLTAAGAAGSLQGELPAASLPETGPVELTLRWAGGDLATARIAGPAPVVVAPVEPAVPPWPALLASPETPFQGGGPPSRAARPHAGAGLSLFVATAPDHGEPLGSPLLRLGLDASWAPAGGDWGIDAELPWYSADLDDELAGRNELGDLRLGGRRLLVARPDLALALSLRLTLPTGGLPRATRTVFAEPGLLVDWELRPDWLLRTNQVLVVGGGADDAPGFAYAGSLGLDLLHLRPFVLGLELQTLLGLFGEQGIGELRALSLGAGLGWEFAAWRIGLYGGQALTDDADQWFGGRSLGLRVELRG
ncbi:MAG: FecR domain-containing protein [Myxococcota bacterium]|jgi:hypothetical protein|nr:FecR domain-containing protein [Myxococcota bacterium]